MEDRKRLELDDAMLDRVSGGAYEDVVKVDDPLGSHVAPECKRDDRESVVTDGK